MLPPSLRQTFRRDMLVRRSGSRFELNSSKLFYLFIYLNRTTARASPIGIPRDIYSAYCKLE